MLKKARERDSLVATVRYVVYIYLLPLPKSSQVSKTHHLHLSNGGHRSYII